MNEKGINAVMKMRGRRRVVYSWVEDLWSRCCISIVGRRDGR